MYTHLLLISTVQIPRAYCSFFYYNIFIVSEQVFYDFLWIWADMLECAIHPITYRGEGILATVVKDEWIDLIRLFFLRCGFVSRLLIAVIRPIFSETEDTYDNILFVIVNGGLYSPTKTPPEFPLSCTLSCTLFCVLSSSII